MQILRGSLAAMALFMPLIRASNTPTESEVQNLMLRLNAVVRGNAVPTNSKCYSLWNDAKTFIERTEDELEKKRVEELIEVMIGLWTNHMDTKMNEKSFPGMTSWSVEEIVSQPRIPLEWVYSKAKHYINMIDDRVNNHGSYPMSFKDISMRLSVKITAIEKREAYNNPTIHELLHRDEATIMESVNSWKQYHKDLERAFKRLEKKYGKLEKSKTTTEITNKLLANLEKIVKKRTYDPFGAETSDDIDYVQDIEELISEMRMKVDAARNWLNI